MIAKIGLYVEGLSAYRVADKLNQAGIGLYALKKVQKKGVYLEVALKDRKKVFAILQGSCYNIVKARPRGLVRLAQKCVQSAGIVLGAILFFLGVTVIQTRVVSVRVTGSGAYLEPQVREILALGGVGTFSAAPEDTSAFRAAVLSLPRVNFCSFRHAGGVLTVTVEVSDESAAVSKEQLFAPADGIIEELVVVRGTACLEVGAEVKKGDVVVRNSVLFGEEERPVIVIARVKVRYSFAREYAIESEEKAILQVTLDYGETEEVHTTKTETGWLVEGTAFASASVNLG